MKGGGEWKKREGKGRRGGIAKEGTITSEGMKEGRELEWKGGECKAKGKKGEGLEGGKGGKGACEIVHAVRIAVLNANEDIKIYCNQNMILIHHYKLHNIIQVLHRL